MGDDDVAIKVEHVSKTFKLPHEKHSSIKGALIRLVNGGKRTFERQEVLKDVSFKVKKGEFFGIVGRNGSGKSTLLKMLAGIYTPTKGVIQVNGKLTPFIELGVGFSPELTGRENVYLNGALLGFNHTEMDAMYEEVVAFAELEKFMDQKLKNYSSGMQVRLAFSIAIRAETDILLIDEVLAVGDAAFQQKCYETFSEMKRKGRTIVLVTHDMSAVSRFCDKALLIRDGLVKEIGKPKDIADAYLELNYNDKSSDSLGNEHNEKADTDLVIKKVTLNGKDTDRVNLETKGACVVGIKYLNVQEKSIQFGVQIFNDAGNYCFGTNTRIAKLQIKPTNKGEITLDIELNLLPGNYTITVAIMNDDATKVFTYKPNAKSFRISKTTEVEGIANLTHKWSAKGV